MNLKPEDYIEFSKQFGIDWRPEALEKLKEQIGTNKPTRKQRIEMESHLDNIFWAKKMLEWAELCKDPNSIY